MPTAIVENEADGIVLVAGVIMPGWIDVAAPCPGCGSPSVYHLGHEAHFCPDCNRWMDRHCEDAECMYCGSRRDPPLRTTT